MNYRTLLLTALIASSIHMPVWSQVNTQSDTITRFQVAQKMEQRNLAVVDFNNDTGLSQYDNLKRGVAESLMTKLARRPELTLVERNQLEKAIKELGFGQSAYASGTQAKEIGKMAGADYLVTGNILKAGARFEINVRMIEVETAKVIVSESYAFQSENDTLMVVDYLSLLIPKKLGLYVSDSEMDLAKNRLRASTQTITENTGSDNNWIWWAVGGAVVVGAAVTVAVLATRQGGSTTTNNNNNNTNTVTVGERKAAADRLRRTNLTDPQFNFSLLSF